ncbi:MAG: homocysteine S-methyltransferase family protein [Desulfuromonadales bacterium]
MNAFLQAIKERVLILDGAMGTLLQMRGLCPGGCPEELNRISPDLVAGIHAEYAAAGADIVVVNSFGGNRVKLGRYGLERAVSELNHRAVELACGAVDADVLVCGSVGPTGRFLEPAGDAAFDEMVAIFAEQITALAEAGADLISFETFLDIRELRAGIIACRDVCTLPIFAQMTFDDAGRTFLGTPPCAAAVTLDALQVDVIGANCGSGIDGIYEMLAEMRTVTSRPLIAPIGGGLPNFSNGQTVFPATPVEMTTFLERLVAVGVRIMGGCSGTTPAQIRAMREALETLPQDWSEPARRCFLSSRSAVLEIGGKTPCLLIGERINPTGKKSYSDELKAGKTAFIRREAVDQVAAGADALDINCGAPGVDEAAALEQAVFAASSATAVPLVLDTTDANALERALQAADGKVLINSVTGEADSMAKILPLARRYGAALIGLTFDEAGIPETAEGRVAVAEKICRAVVAVGLPKQDLLVDCLTLTVSAEQPRALETLRALRIVHDQLGLATVLGVSNISFGLPARPILSSTFFAMALAAGLQAAIINPGDERMMDTYRAAMVLLGQDQRGEAYIDRYADPPAVSPATAPAQEQTETITQGFKTV